MGKTAGRGGTSREVQASRAAPAAGEPGPVEKVPQIVSVQLNRPTVDGVVSYDGSRCTIVEDAIGIRIEGTFRTKRYPWSSVFEVIYA